MKKNNSLINTDDYKRLIKMLSVQFPKSEIVLHDLTNGYESTIVAIENNEITGRCVGDCGSNLGLEALHGGKEPDSKDQYGYTTYLKDGRILRSSTMYLMDDKNKIVGALCINTDITAFNMLNGYMQSLLPDKNSESNVNEVFARNIGELLDYYIDQCRELFKKDGKSLTKEEKLEAVRYFDSKGVFLISKAGSRVCKFLDISKGTLYSYLEIAREEAE